MRHAQWSKRGATFALLAVALLAVAGVIGTSAPTDVRTPKHAEAQVRQDAIETRCAPVSLPVPLPRRGEVVRPAAATVTPQEQALAGRRVIAGNIVRALGQAASTGDAKAVEDLTKGLPRYGAAARDAIQEELGRVKDPKAKDALVRALGRLDS